MPDYGAFSSNRIQMGRESTAGNEVDATVIWRGPAIDIEDARTIVRPEENVGLLVPTSRAYIPKYGVALALPETEATYEQLPNVFEAGIMTATPSAGPPYTYTYTPGTTAGAAIKTYTLETENVIAGDANTMVYGFVESFTLTGKAGEAWKVSSNWLGRTKTVKAGTGSLSLSTLEEILFSETNLYIDATGDWGGATRIAGALLEASITVNTGIQAVYTADGELYFRTHKFTKPTLEFSLTVELEDAGGEGGAGVVAVERAYFASQSTRAIKLVTDGTASRKLDIRMAAKYDSIGSYQNSNENTTVTFSGRAVYVSTLPTTFFSFAVTNLLATLP